MRAMRATDGNLKIVKGLHRQDDACRRACQRRYSAARQAAQPPDSPFPQRPPKAAAGWSDRTRSPRGGGTSMLPDDDEALAEGAGGPKPGADNDEGEVELGGAGGSSAEEQRVTGVP